MEVKAVKHYDMKKNYTFTIQPNKMYMLLGDNGLGKTTLLKIMAGYIKPKQGMIKSQFKSVSFVFGMKYIPHHLTVKQYFDGLYTLYGWMFDPLLLHLFKIPLDKRIHALSFGQKQKLFIIQAFMGNPDLVLLDEPLIGLDQQSILHFETYLNQAKQTVVLTTHIELNINAQTITL
jgi:ABC-2 type transport system ATP-binding protein